MFTKCCFSHVISFIFFELLFQQVSYVQEEEVESEGVEDEDEWDASEPEPRAKKRAPAKPPSESSAESQDSSDSDDDYEKLRQKNIRERLELVKLVNLNDHLVMILVSCWFSSCHF